MDSNNEDGRAMEHAGLPQGHEYRQKLLSDGMGQNVTESARTIQSETGAMGPGSPMIKNGEVGGQQRLLFRSIKTGEVVVDSEMEKIGKTLTFSFSLKVAVAT